LSFGENTGQCRKGRYGKWSYQTGSCSTSDAVALRTSRRALVLLDHDRRTPSRFRRAASAIPALAAADDHAVGWRVTPELRRLLLLALEPALAVLDPALLDACPCGRVRSLQLLEALQLLQRGEQRQQRAAPQAQVPDAFATLSRR